MFKQILSFVLSACCAGLLSTAVTAQGNSYGYLLAGPGGTAPNGGGATLQIAGGGEGVFKNGAGFGAELGYLLPFEAPGSGLGTFALNGSYHFLKAGGKTVPFVTGGYSGFFRSGYLNGVNFGVGANYWFKERTGLRVEFRDNIAVGNGDAVHFLNVRAGVTFR
ncbi:MAG: hypothetical protein HYR56_18605 [Acidobacteria bacterium]|nr:hypothetical protein [Acidobacteriota bacterium]MBI3424748.1 hypothetical protein [Acidobacteriota bacterium]